MVVLDLLTNSARKIGAVASGEALTAAEAADWLSALQSMLRSWASKKVLVFAGTKESFALVPGTYQYTWGSGGTFATARPNRVEGAYVLDSGGVSHPVDIISEDRYRQLTLKATVGRPTGLFFHPLYPLAYVYLYPVPDAAETLYVDSIKPFTETSSFSATTDTLIMPLEYEEPIIYNLAVRIAPEIGRAVSAEVAAIATSSLENIVSLNASNQVSSIDITIPAGTSSGRYDINEG